MEFKRQHYLVIKFVEAIFLLAGSGTIYYSFNGVWNLDTVVIIYGTAVAFTILSFLLLISVVFKREPHEQWTYLLNGCAFIFFSLMGILLIIRSAELVKEKYSAPYLEEYNSGRFLGSSIRPLNSVDKCYIYLGGGIVSILNAICFAIEVLWKLKITEY